VPSGKLDGVDDADDADVGVGELGELGLLLLFGELGDVVDCAAEGWSGVLVGRQSHCAYGEHPSYSSVPFLFFRPTARPTANATINIIRMARITATLFPPPLFAICLLFRNLVNFSPSLQTLYE
jgi:hypothetical protein